MDTDRIIKDLSKKYNKDERVIRSIANSPFLFAKKTISSLEDDLPIRIPYFGVFVLRYKHTKDIIYLMLLRDITKKLIEKYEEGDTSIVVSIDVIIEVLLKKGYHNEQFVQHLIEWKNRVEAGDTGSSSI